MVVGYAHQSVHITHIPIEVYRHDRFRARCNGVFELTNIQIEGTGFHDLGRWFLIRSGTKRTCLRYFHEKVDFVKVDVATETQLPNNFDPTSIRTLGKPQIGLVHVGV